MLGIDTCIHTKTGNAKVDTTITTTFLFGANGQSLVPQKRLAGFHLKYCSYLVTP